MVVFTCNACCAVLKRNQVDKHCDRCRRCESLSCVDCGKDFWGDDYQQHMKCITEDEKYGPKDNVPKVFKGEAKQEQWVEQVQSAIDKASSKPKLRGLLERIKEYSNIPRKKAKFENFVKNSLRVNNPSLISEVWDVLMAGYTKPQPQNGSKKESDGPETKSEPESVSVNGGEDKNGNDHIENGISETNVPKNKREKKEERRQKAHKKEKKDKSAVDTTDDNVPAVEVTKKSKKRKRQESEEGLEDNSVGKENESLKKKKKKNKGDISSESIKTEDANSNNDDEEEEEAPPSKKKKTKFNWESVIKSVLEKKGEMNLKKLKKKVLSEFAAQDAANYNEDNLSAKFDKKVLKTPGVKVAKDRATLKT